jgi:hypothetical protein
MVVAANGFGRGNQMVNKNGYRGWLYRIERTKKQNGFVQNGATFGWLTGAFMSIGYSQWC